MTRKVLPYDVIQILIETSDGGITTMAWALPDGLDEYWRREITAIHGPAGAEQIISPDAAERFMNAGQEALDDNSMMMFVNGEEA